MDAPGKKSRLGWTFGLSLGAPVGGIGCDQLAGDESASDNAAMAIENGVSSLNGVTTINGMSITNGVNTGNGVSTFNGINTTNGISTTNGLMTTAMGRRTVQYIASCALDSSQTLSKQDQYGHPYNYPGAVGLAPGWYNNGITVADEANVSACLMARINSAGMHVPLWMDASQGSIGWGYDPNYPNQEGSYFGNVMRTDTDGLVHAFFCNGRDYLKGIVPGRLGADDTSSMYQNPFGTNALCDNNCKYPHSSTKPDGTSVVDGYGSCNGVANPITVFRKASYNPVFDDNYVYKLVNASSHLALDVYNWGTGENTNVCQYTSYNQANQHFRIIQVASSQWKIIDMNSGKAITNRNGNAANVQINSYVNQASDNWAIDDHNGHFILRNKATSAYLHSPGSGLASFVNVTTSYNGTPDTDWDLIVVDSL